jgi:peptidoglycan-associated lipoprotein
MSKFIRIACRLLPGVVALVVFTGCRKPTLNLNGDLTRPPMEPGSVGTAGTAFPMNPGGADVEPFQEGTGWGSLDEALDNGQDAAGEPKRWEGVAVYFAYDSAAVGPSEMPKIKTLADWLKSHPGYGVVVEGNCDQRGSDEYNRALGQQRAIVVRDHLCALGIAEDRIETVSYGEERPAVPNATTEAEYQKNRRDEFLIGPLKK